jgi:hypothetical protein
MISAKLGRQPGYIISDGFRLGKDEDKNKERIDRS